MLMATTGIGSTERKRDLITHNFLGVCPAIEISHEDLDLSLEVKSSGWKKTQLTNIMNHGMVTTKTKQNDQNSSLDLKLTTHINSSPAPYQSVCTLEKVKSALERAKHDTNYNDKSKKMHQLQPMMKLHVASPSSTSSSSSITTSNSSAKRKLDGDEDGMNFQANGSLLAAGCPSCLMYVLISKGNPTCPRCEAQVPLTQLGHIVKANKKPRIDLNFALNDHH